MTENTPNSNDEPADDQPDIKTLAERVDQLEERQQELRQGAVDAQGRNWTLSDLLNLGLTRRQALSAIAALAGGATIGTAMMQAVSPASADPGDSGNTVLGAPDNRWDAWMGEVSIEHGEITDEELGLIFGSSRPTRVASERDNAREALTVRPIDGNHPGSVETFPSGTSNRSHFLAGNAPDPDNFGFVKLEGNATAATLHAGAKGTGTAPTAFEFREWLDGISFLQGTPGIRDAQGTPSSPEQWVKHGSDVDATGIQNAATQVVADNTAQDILTPSDPAFSGMAVVVGTADFSPRFTDVIVNVRQDTVVPIAKTDGDGSPGARIYSMDGVAVQVAIDGSGDTYDVTVIHMGGGS